jgi:hypothetical protein
MAGKRLITMGLLTAAVALPSSADARSIVVPRPLHARAQPAFRWSDAGKGAIAAVVALGGVALASGATRRRGRPRTARPTTRLSESVEG